MVKVRSLKHVRYVIAGVTPEGSMLPNRQHYWTEPPKGDKRGVAGTWTEELGDATIFQDYSDARAFHKLLKEKYPDVVESNGIKVEIITAKAAMIAKLRVGADNE